MGQRIVHALKFFSELLNVHVKRPDEERTDKNLWIIILNVTIYITSLYLAIATSCFNICHFKSHNVTFCTCDFISTKVTFFIYQWFVLLFWQFWLCISQHDLVIIKKLWLQLPVLYWSLRWKRTAQDNRKWMLRDCARSLLSWCHFLIILAL